MPPEPADFASAKSHVRRDDVSLLLVASMEEDVVPPIHSCLLATLVGASNRFVNRGGQIEPGSARLAR